jgi:hypothetical protein
MSLEVVHLDEDAVDHPGVVEPATCGLAALSMSSRALVLAVRGCQHHAFAVYLELGVPDRPVLHDVPLSALLESECPREPVDSGRRVLVRDHRKDPLRHVAWISYRGSPSSGNVSQGATERTKMCASGSPSKPESIALSRTLHVSDSGHPPPNRFEPQTEQNVFAEPSAGVYGRNNSSPSRIRTASVRVRPLVVPTPPEIRLQFVQWHCETLTNGSAISNRTPPQRQLPCMLI